MVASISPDPRLQFFANDGSPLVGGKLYTYAAGTTTPLATYTSITGLVANTNPVILDSRGEASVWLTSAKYKFVLKTAADVEIWTQDNLWAAANVDGSNATGTWPISISGNAATATYATTAGSVTPGNAVTSIAGAGLYGFTLPGGPITSTGTLTVTPPVPGASGNVLTSDGTNWVPSAGAYPLTSGTAVASTSGVSIDFTSIPSWVKCLTILFTGASTATASNPSLAFQLGTSGGMVSSGYLGSTSSTYGAGSVNSLIAFSTNFQFIQATSAAHIAHGRVVFQNVTGNTWVATGQLAQSDTTRVSWFSGAIALASILTQVRITTVGGTDAFDAGTINILYE
jgi:hypothetical protein